MQEQQNNIFTDDYNNAPLEENIFWAPNGYQIVGKNIKEVKMIPPVYPPRRFKTIEDVKNNRPVQMYK